MTKEPDPAAFSVNERPNEYRADIRVEGTMSVMIKATSESEAERMAEEVADEIAEGKREAELDEVDDVSVSWVFKTKPLFRVMRDGRPMQVTTLEPGDLPREPDERGF